MALKFVQAQPFQLAGAGSSIGDSTLIIQSFNDINGTALTMADFGDKGYGTLEPGSGPQEEQISFTEVTNNGDGTWTLTGVKNVLFKYPYTETSGMTKSHAGGTNFVISNTSAFYNYFSSNANWQTPVATVGALPAGVNIGEVRVTLDTNQVYIWNGVAWVVFTAPALNTNTDYFLGSQSIGSDLKTFQSSINFSANKNIKVYLSGSRQAEGSTADYQCSGNNRIIFNNVVNANDIIVLDITQ